MPSSNSKEGKGVDSGGGANEIVQETSLPSPSPDRGLSVTTSDGNIDYEVVNTLQQSFGAEATTDTGVDSGERLSVQIAELQRSSLASMQLTPVELCYDHVS